MSVPSRHRACLITTASLVLATVLAYANSLHAPFVFDDAPAIVENPSIRSLSPLSSVLSPPSTAGSAAGRPLINLSFALNYAAGGLNPRGYHLVNLALHACAALALFGLVRRTLLSASLRERFQRDALPLAGIIALLWTVHPLLTESVTCTVQRTELLGGLFYFLTLYGFIRALEPGAAKFWSVLAVVACFAGVASKEIVATAPLLALTWDCLFAAGSLRAALRLRGKLYLALASSWLLLGWLIITSQQRGGVVGFGHGVSAWAYLLTQCQAIVLYLKLSFWPHPLVLDYGTDVVRQLSDVLPQAIFLVLLATATVYGLWRRRPAAFAGAWFFAILAPSSSVVPLVSQTMAEHRMYLPLAAVLTLIVLTAHRWLGRITPLVFCAVALGFACLTVQRNATYASPVSIWTDTVTKRPDNSRAHSLLGLALEKAGRLDEAVVAAQAAARLAPGSAEMHYNLGYALVKTGRPADAIASFETALRLRPDYAEAHCNLSVALIELRRGREAFEHLTTALQLRPNYADAHYNLGNLFARTRRLDEAIAHFESAVRLEPARADIHFNLARALFETGRPAEAAAHYETVLRLTPDDADAVRNLAQARAAAPRP